jgi:hypothetical protein
MKHEPFEDNWQALFQRLDSAKCGFRGYCLDPADSKEPYSMEFVITTTNIGFLTGVLAETVAKEVCSVRGMEYVQANEFTGFCRWRSLGDSITRVSLFYSRLREALLTVDVNYFVLNGTRLASHTHEMSYLKSDS